jgi:hypothetical protein
MADLAARQQEASEPAARETVTAASTVVAQDRSGARVVTPDDLDLTHADDIRPTSGLFVRPEPRSTWPPRLAVAAIIVLLVVTGIALGSRSTPADDTSRMAAGTASAPAGMLELLSLDQAQAADALTITGLVQNPRGGAVLSQVIATALLFGPDGTLVASGRAPLDFTVLRPGDECGFVISVPVSTQVARYRVGFRGEDGRVIGHIDRRTSSAMAGDGQSVPAARGTS